MNFFTLFLGPILAIVLVVLGFLVAAVACLAWWRRTKVASFFLLASGLTVFGGMQLVDTILMNVVRKEGVGGKAAAAAYLETAAPMKLWGTCIGGFLLLAGGFGAAVAARDRGLGSSDTVKPSPRPYEPPST